MKRDAALGLSFVQEDQIHSPRPYLRIRAKSLIYEARTTSIKFVSKIRLQSGEDNGIPTTSGSWHKGHLRMLAVLRQDH